MTGRKILLVSVVYLSALLVIPVFAWAGEATPASNAVAIDTVWTLMATFLIFIMQAGFAMVETGFTRAKNAANIIMKKGPFGTGHPVNGLHDLPKHVFRASGQ